MKEQGVCSDTVTVTPVAKVSENYLVVEKLQEMPGIIARGLLYIIFLLVLTAAIYVTVGKIDILVVSQATTWPDSHKVRIISDRSGILEKIYASEGLEVQKNTSLFLIRSKETLNFRSKADELRKIIPLKEVYYTTNIQSLTEELKYLDTERANILGVKRLKLSQNDMSMKGIDSDISFWSKEKINLEEEFENTRKLYDKRMTSIGEYNYFKGRLEKARTELEKMKSQKSIQLSERDILEKEIKSSIDGYNKKKAVLEKEIRNLGLEKETTLQSLRSELKTAEEILMLRQCEAVDPRSPAGDDQTIRTVQPGKISEVFFKNEGEYIRESDLLCTIVPTDSPLRMDIVVQNKDIGFIQAGMPIRYKFDPFPYADYGTIQGHVASIAPSAVEDGKNNFVYHVRGTLDKDFFEIDGRKYPIKVGMTAVAELVTDRKRLLSLLVRRVKK